MRVKIFDVRVPDSTTRFYQVPEYDVPIIRRIWHGRLKPDAYGNRAELVVMDQGVIEGRSLHSEKLRIRRDWTTQPEGSRLPAWQEIYPTDANFHEAWQKAVDKCAAEEAKSVPAEPYQRPGWINAPINGEGQMVGAGAPASPASSSLFSPPPAIPAAKRRGGRPKK